LQAEYRLIIGKFYKRARLRYWNGENYTEKILLEYEPDQQFKSLLRIYYWEKDGNGWSNKEKTRYNGLFTHTEWLMLIHSLETSGN